MWDNKNNVIYIISLYVDDILITVIKEEITRIINIIKNKFKIFKWKVIIKTYINIIKFVPVI